MGPRHWLSKATKLEADSELLRRPLAGLSRRCSCHWFISRLDRTQDGTSGRTTRLDDRIGLRRQRYHHQCDLALLSETRFVRVDRRQLPHDWPANLLVDYLGVALVVWR